MVKVAVVGATGAVGEVMRQVLLEHNFPISEIRFLASEKSVGKPLTFHGKVYTILPIAPASFEGIDVVLSSTPSSVSLTSSPMAAAMGAIVVDNSSAWRMDPLVPLVVPEVNPDHLDSIPKGIVANPNCSTIQMVVALKPLHDAAILKRVIVSTYQASSGKGAKGLEDLDAQVQAIGKGEPVPPAKAHIAQLAGNVLAHDRKMAEEGYSEEEWKMIRETQKILSLLDLAICPTTVRVPVRTGHSESLNVEFVHPLSPEKAKEILGKAPGIQLFDELLGAETPQPLLCLGKDEVFVGRVRRDLSVANGLALWVVADNLRKGAATNAVQIAETLIKRGIIPKKR